MTSSTPLLSIRTAFILLVAVVCGTAAGCLLAVAGHHVALAVVVGLGSTGSTITVLHKLIAF